YRGQKGTLSLRFNMRGGPALLRDGTRLKFERSREVLGKILPVVTSGVNMRFVREVPRTQDVVQGPGASLEAKIVLVATVEINFQAGESRSPRRRQRRIALPEGRIRRRTECFSQDPRPHPAPGIW